MTEQPHEVPETFAFTCGSCGHHWEAAFRLLFFTDPLSPTGGTTQEYVDEAGRAVRSPLTDAVCPRCGGRRVTVLEPERARREARAEHAEEDRAEHGDQQAQGHLPRAAHHRPHLPRLPHGQHGEHPRPDRSPDDGPDAR
ncbi:hypothetical protein ABTX35_08140 [Streptomyces sp. NPDC096080]|uniref:hypothetical protein n=1 Tax=Streptomyces sp. NPDC096080 TaxID=3156693 RepID=UPI00331F7874